MGLPGAALSGAEWVHTFPSVREAAMTVEDIRRAALRFDREP